MFTVSKYSLKLIPFSTLALLLTIFSGCFPTQIVIQQWATQSAIAQTTSTPTQVYQQASPAVVTIKDGTGHGSGFIISSDGLIITNAHVVENSPRIVTVLFSDGRQAPADVIGFAHNGIDLAALRIYGKENLPSLSLAPADSIQVGQNIFVIGTPLDEEYQNTLSKGIISRFNPQDGIIQHNANTNPGNSGGPVLNHKGQVLGVHFSGDVRSRVYGDSGQAIGTTKSGINFAISLDRLQAFLKTIKTGKVSRNSTLSQPQQQRTILTLPSQPTTLTAKLDSTDVQLTEQMFIDLYQFEGKVGQTLNLTLESNDFNPVLQLFYVDTSGEERKYLQVARNDDRGPADFTAYLNVSLPKDGLYYVGATTAEVGEQGSYRMQIGKLSSQKH